MPTLPWTPSGELGVTPARVTVMGSRLELKSYFAIPGFFRAAFKVRRQVREAPGAIGVALIAQPSRKTFWTLSAWTDQSALHRFVATSPHREVMAKYGPRLVGSGFQTFEIDASEIPAKNSNARDLWAEAKRRLAVPPEAT